MKSIPRPLLILFSFTVFFGCAKQRTARIEPNPVTFGKKITRPTYDLFEQIAPKPELENVVKSAVFFKLDSAELQRLYLEQPAHFTLQLPDIQGLPSKIVFDKKQVTSPGLLLHDQNMQPFEVKEGIHYRQVQPGESMAAISIFENHLAAIFATASGDFSLSELTASPGEYILFNEASLVEKPEPFTCTPLYPEGFKMPKYQEYTLPKQNGNPEFDPGDPVVRVYVECDKNMLTMTGGAVQGVYDYVTTLFNFTALVYEGEDIIIQLSEMLVWTEQDPYNTSDALSAFAYRWQENHQNYNGGLGHLLRGFSSGGLAWVDVLCNPYLPLSLSGMGAANWNNFPNFVYQVYVFAHELGHNLGSPHTHNCSWGPNNDQTIDNCAFPEGGCDWGPPPVDGGTIMSYCSGFNLLNGFGPEPGDLIRLRVAEAACLKNLAFYNMCQVDSVTVYSECLPGGTPSDPSDNQYNVHFNVKGTGNPMTLRATDLASGQSWLFSHNAGLTIGPFPALTGPRNIRIEDLSNPACTTERTVFPSAECYRPDLCASVVWNKTLGGSDFETYKAVAAYPDGSVIGVGRVESDDGDFSPTDYIDMFIVKYDAGGNKLWQKQYTGESIDEPFDVIALPDGGALVAGITWSYTGFGSGQHGGGDGFALRLDASGNQLWRRFYGGGSDDRFHAAIQMPGGDFVFAGTSWSNDGDVSGNHGKNDGWLLRTGSDGDIVWSKLYGDEEENTVENINLGNGPTLAVSGARRDANADPVAQEWAAETDFNGGVNWQNIYPSPLDAYDTGMLPNDNGGYLLIYISNDRPNASRLDASGNLLQNRVIVDRAGVHLEDAVKLSGNRIAATGWRRGTVGVEGSDFTTDDAWIYLMDGDGNLIWDKTFGEHRREVPYAICPSADGGYFLAGHRETGFETNSYDAWLVKLGADFCSDPNLCFLSTLTYLVECHDNGTVNDLTDDVFTFDLIVNQSGTCGSGWTGGGASGPYGLLTAMGPYPIADGPQVLTFTDLDDPSVTTTLTVEPPGPCSYGPSFCDNNILLNPGFETTWSTLYGWQTEGDVTESDNPHQGENAAQICGNMGNMTQVKPAVPGQEYTASVWVRKTSASTGYSFFTLRFLTASWQPLPHDMEVFTNTAYQQIVQTKTAPPDAAYVQVLLWKEAGGCVETDDWELCESETQPACEINAEVGNATCYDNQTPGDPSDDTFWFTIQAGNPAQSSGYQIFIPESGQTLTGGYGWVYTYGNFEISDGPFTLIFTDNDTPGCTTSVVVTPPPPCSAGDLPDFELSSFIATQLVGGSNPQIHPNDEVVAGTTVYFPDHFANLTFPVQMPTFTVTISAYLSHDWTLDGSDLLLTSGTRIIDANVQTWGFTEGNFGSNSQIPLSTAPGNYYIIVKYDSENAIAESDETNNMGILPIVVTSGATGQIDLELSLAQSNPTPQIYTGYSVIATLTNKGSQPATGVKVKFAKPNGVVYTGGNEWTASQGSFNTFGQEVWNMGSIPAGGSATLTVNYFLLQNGAPNAYAQVAAANEQDVDSTPGNGTPPTPNEDDEASTGTSPPPFLQPDLLLSDLVVTNSPIQPGNVLTYNFTISNTGNGPASENFNVKAWISTTPYLTGSGIQDGIVPTGNFPAGFAVQGVPGASTLPAGLAEGQYYLLLKVDADEAVAESNETNNWLTGTFIVLDAQQPGDCDDFIGTGFVSCVSHDAAGRLEVVYQPNGQLRRATLDGTGQVVSDNFAGTPLPGITYSVEGLDLVKRSDGNEVYRIAVPAPLSGQYEQFAGFTEYQGGYLLFAFEDLGASPLPVQAIRTDLNFNVLQTNEFYLGPSNTPPLISNALQISANEVAFFYLGNYNQYGYNRIQLVVLDGALEVQSTEILAQDDFSAYAKLRPNFCGGYSLDIFKQLYFCVHGSCYDNEYRNGHFENGAFVTDDSYRVSEVSAYGMGAKNQTWTLRTDDGGFITGAQTQQLPISSNPPDNVIHLEKTLGGTAVWEKDVTVASAAAVRRLAMTVDELVFLSEKTGGVFIETLTCLENNTQPPGDRVDLELTLTTANPNPPIYTAVQVVLTVKNAGAHPASGVIAEWKKPSGTVYTGGSEWTATQGFFNPFGNEYWVVGNLAAGQSATLKVNYFLLTGNALTPFAQVAAQNETDADSSPGNGTCCTPGEDDEATLTLNAFSGNPGASLQLPEMYGRDVQLKAIHPNPVYFGEITLTILSRVEGAFDLECYDVLGNLAFLEKIELKEGRNDLPADVSRLAGGMYHLNVRGQNWRYMPLRFVVAKW